MKHVTACLIFSGILFWQALSAQFAPAVGKPGCTALFKDSSAFVAWAVSAEINRGPMQVGIDSLGLASVGTGESALGKAGENGIVSLGDGGTATLQFANPIRDGQGWDFAVFENSFDGLFLELAFVEVSSDGERFVRFPSTSLTDTAKHFTGFDTLNPEQIHNLAGKYISLYGTPFDLSELADSSGIDIQRITHVRLVDVIGTAQPEYAQRDAGGRIVRDPWPTPFPSSGFDLDAVGVIHQQDPNSIESTQFHTSFEVFPQPARNECWLNLNGNHTGTLQIFTLSGALLIQTRINGIMGEPVHIKDLNIPAGMYLMHLHTESGRLMHTRFLVSD